MKKRILETARHLYNNKGLSQVTTRIICQHLKISLGSFSYHFPDKTVIVKTLFNEMLGEMDAVYYSMQTKEVDIVTYLETHKALFLIQEKYRFFYLNLFEILSAYPEIQQVYQERRRAEIEMAKQSLAHYSNHGILKKELSNQQVDRLVNVGLILNNFWPMDATLSTYKNDGDRMLHYMKICCGLMEPYLASASLEKYRLYFSKMEADESSKS